MESVAEVEAPVVDLSKAVRVSQDPKHTGMWIETDDGMLCVIGNAPGVTNPYVAVYPGKDYQKSKNMPPCYAMQYAEGKLMLQIPGPQFQIVEMTRVLKALRVLEHMEGLLKSAE